MEIVGFLVLWINESFYTGLAGIQSACVVKQYTLGVNLYENYQYLGHCISTIQPNFDLAVIFAGFIPFQPILYIGKSNN